MSCCDINENAPGLVPGHFSFPTATDPAVATIFATESENYGKGVLYITSTNEISSLGVTENILAEAETEVAINVAPSLFPKYATRSITAEQSRAILKEMGIALPTKVRDKEHISTLLKEVRKLTPKEINTYLKKVEELNKKP